MHSPIIPVTVFPDSATILYIWNGFSVKATTHSGENTIPTFSYSLQNDDRVQLKNGEIQMTADQWNNWSSSDQDENYILNCISTNLGVTLSSGSSV